jgi:hypothetical protein
LDSHYKNFGKSLSESAADEMVLIGKNSIKFLQKSFNSIVSYILNFYIKKFYRFATSEVLTNQYYYIYEDKVSHLRELSVNFFEGIDEVIK